MNTDDRVLLPIGHLLGSICYGEDAASAAYTVRRGRDDLPLPNPEFIVWMLAHGLPDRLELPWTVGAVRAAAAEAGVEDPGGVIDRLVDRGLLAAVAVGTDEVRMFSATHQAHPLLLGIGNTPDDLGMFRVGTVDSVAVTLSLSAYVLWSRAYLEENLLAACASLADDLPAAATGEDPVELADGFLRIAHHILAVNGMYLDVVVPARESVAA